MRSEFGADYAREQLRRSAHPLRRVVKTLYLRNILRHVDGPSIDFGCGAGQLLERLPAGSIGLEINPFLVESLRKKALNVQHYDPQSDGFALSALPANYYSTLIMAHVLEHFADASSVLKRVLGACRRLGVRRMVLIVPGWKGYLSDPTHKTFVDLGLLRREALLSCEGYQAHEISYFPLNREACGRYFIFHEFCVVFGRVPQS